MSRQKMTPRTLSRQYRYSTAWAGPLGEGITIQPVGMDDPREQNRFHTEINLISRLLFGPGAAANTVYNAHGPIIFQHPDMNINRQRAKQVTGGMEAVEAGRSRYHCLLQEQKSLKVVWRQGISAFRTAATKHRPRSAIGLHGIINLCVLRTR